MSLENIAENLREAYKQNPDLVTTLRSTFSCLDYEKIPTLEQLEKAYISRVLEATNGNKTYAAKLLGINRRTLYRKLDSYSKE